MRVKFLEEVDINERYDVELENGDIVGVDEEYRPEDITCGYGYDVLEVEIKDIKTFRKIDKYGKWKISKLDKKTFYVLEWEHVRE